MNHRIRLSALALCLLAAPVSAAVPGGEALADLITGEFDSNADALIDSGEWQSGIGSSFAKLDANGDGSISLDEADTLKSDVATQTGDLGAAVVVVLIRQVLASLDTDGDQLISRAEYDKLSQDIFAKLDADKNNALNRIELAELPLKIIVN
jgi:hypothetical protein